MSVSETGAAMTADEGLDERQSNLAMFHGFSGWVGLG